METKRLAERITKGEATVQGNGVHNPKGNCIALSFTDRDANAELIAEAFNVTNSCGYTPKELLEQRNEAIELFKLIKSGQRVLPSWNKVDEFIKKYQP